ncbi:helix-turn-helix domain-containing protein [Streptosporangium lutulentum]|uniref:Transcriptional regulator with XRE-family HTH domain n=1 Tax=Streptosporangium lutulentum TaxID=1461250 RepID=A0ABT9QAQ8_9ACTN|nr:helix-turn-helix domain-containing protein [Streptosporangium lutulentum]MDP9843024.1 transcriptional regulator with XRE-family HTH domain [Streptosporangium lutulentum]
MKRDLGTRLRTARLAKGRTLRTVATAAGISPSLLSQVETGKSQPSVSTLYSLVTHLGLSIDELLAVSAEPPTAPAEPTDERSRAPLPESGAIQRREDNPMIEMENGVTWERLAVGGFGIADPLVTTYAPGGSSSIDGRLMRHSGVEYGYIIEGELTLKLDFDTFTLRTGDSVCFNSVRPHLYINQTGNVTRGLWVVVGGHDNAAASDLLAEHAVPLAGDRSMRTAVDVLAAMREPGRR